MEGTVDMGADEYLGEVAAVPTVNEWGMMIFMVLAGIGSVYYLRRRTQSGSYILIKAKRGEKAISPLFFEDV